jgi:hypothetical protein
VFPLRTALTAETPFVDEPGFRVYQAQNVRGIDLVLDTTSRRNRIRLACGARLRVRAVERDLVAHTLILERSYDGSGRGCDRIHYGRFRIGMSVLTPHWYVVDVEKSVLEN